MNQDVQLGMLLGETYRIVRRMGGGGMGEVYEATHERLAGRYAVKVIHADVRDHPEAIARFMREAQVTSGLRHPGIVRVIDFNTLPNGLPYLVMEYLEGEPLGRNMSQVGPFPLERVVEITNQLASALTAAHRQGIVHRDLSPQNIFLVPREGDEPERIKILDFGISKVGSMSKRITGTAVVLGTPQYMAPEQAEGRASELDAQSDQFSLAAIIYEMLTGRAAFSGETLASIAYQIVHARPRSIAHYRPELPPEIESVVAKGLAKKKEDRFPSVSELAVHLRWTASLAAEKSAAGPEAAIAARAPLVSDADETTAVSAVPLGMASLLRESSGHQAQHGDGVVRTGGPRRVSTLGHQAGEALPRGRATTSRLRLTAMFGVACLGAGLLTLALRSAGGGKDRSAPAAAAATDEPVAALPATALTVVAPPPPSQGVDRAAPAGTTPTGAAPVGSKVETAGRLHPSARRVAGRAAGDSHAAASGGECWLTVGSFPWAQLWVDGKDSGQHTPVVHFPIGCGAHKLRFKRPDLKIDHGADVALTAGRELKEHYDLGSNDFDD